MAERKYTAEQIMAILHQIGRRMMPAANLRRDCVRAMKELV